MILGFETAIKLIIQQKFGYLWFLSALLLRLNIQEIKSSSFIDQVVFTICNVWNRPFYSCLLSGLAFEQQQGWS